MIVHQGDNARIVMTCGKVIAEFENGIADVSKDTAAVLGSMGYEVERTEGGNDADRKAENPPVGDKRRRSGKLS